MHLKWIHENPDDYVDKMHGTDKDYYIDSIWNDIKDAKNDIITDSMYLALNLCRVYGYLKDNLILSKKTGGEWGIQSVPKAYQGLIQRAMVCYESDQEMEIDSELVIEYAEYMLNDIEKYCIELF